MPPSPRPPVWGHAAIAGERSGAALHCRPSPFSLLFLFIGGADSITAFDLANRWVRQPRPEESLDKALKAFDYSRRLNHCAPSPSDRVLLTPTGVEAVEVVNLAGSFAHRKGRWKESMTMGRALRYLVEPRILDPLLLQQTRSDELQSCIRGDLKTRSNVPVRVLTAFTHPAVQLELDNGSVSALAVATLRKQVASQGSRLAQAAYDDLAACLERVTLD